MKVYILFRFDWDWAEIEGVFADRKDAESKEAHLRSDPNFDLGTRIEDHEVVYGELK